MNLSLSWLKNNKFLVSALIFALLNMGAIFLIFGFQQYSDSQGYFSAIHFFEGKNVAVGPERILRPLGPLLALPLEFLGEGAGLIAQNMIFYLLCAFLVFKIVDLVYQNKKQAFWASLFFATSTTVIESGLAYLTDMGAWFFYLLSIFLTLLYLRNRDERLIILNGLLSGAGVLMKENGGLGLLFFGLMILFSKEFRVREKMFKIVRFGIFFLIPVSLLQILMFKYFHFTSLDWYLSGRTTLNEEGLLLTFLRYLGQLSRTLGIIWIFFFIGLWRGLKEKDWQRTKIYLALTPASFSFFFWSIAAAGRAVFIFAPLGILLASHGFSWLDNKLGKKRGALLTALLLLVVLILNYSFVWFNSEIPFVDIIVQFFKAL